MATRFVFALQPLLEARRRDEEEMQRALARAKHTRDGDSREVDRLSGALHSGSRALHECVMAGSTAELRVHDAYVCRLERTVRAQSQRSVETAIACERAAAQLLTANRERRLIEKLRERHKQEFEHEAARREELELQDSNANVQMLRKRVYPERSRRAQDDNEQAQGDIR